MVVEKLKYDLAKELGAVLEQCGVYSAAMKALLIRTAIVWFKRLGLSKAVMSVDD